MERRRTVIASSPYENNEVNYTVAGQDRKWHDTIISTTIPVNKNYEFDIINNQIQIFDDQSKDIKEIEYY